MSKRTKTMRPKVGQVYMATVDGEDHEVTIIGKSKRHPDKYRVSVDGSASVMALVAPKDLHPTPVGGNDDNDATPPAKKAGKKASSKKASGKASEKASEKTARAPRRSLINAALLVLAGSKKPLGAKEMVGVAEAKGLYKPTGKTPEATLYSALLTDKHKRAERVDRGVWQLTDAGREAIPSIKAAFEA